MIHPSRRAWHITFGTYAARLHDDARPTVDRRHNQRGQAFPKADPNTQNAPAAQQVVLTEDQRLHVQQIVPAICERGRWTFHACAAACTGDHVHVLLDAHRDRQSKAVRQWLKRWLSESLNETFNPPASGWWAEAGSTKPVMDATYLENVIRYINRQRT